MSNATAQIRTVSPGAFAALRIKSTVAALALLAGGFFVAKPQEARAITVYGAECNVAIFPCPAASTIASGIRVGGPGVLPGNRYTVLPFTFSNGLGSIRGTFVAADIARRFIYLAGFVTGTSNGFVPDLDVGISQNYSTIPTSWTFSGFDIGACGGANPISATVGTFNGTRPIGGGTAACFGPFAQTFGPRTYPEGGVTNMNADAILTFGLGGGSIILPFGDDVPDALFPNLTLTQGETASQFVADLQADGLTVALPEPATWGLMLLGLGITGAQLRSRAVRAAR